MTTATFNFFQRPEHGMGRSFVLSGLVHVVLALVLILGVRWQVRPTEVFEVELVAAPPPPAPVVEAPKPPPPKVEPPPVEKPAPRIEKPQIALPEKPKPKPKVEPKPKPKAEVKPKPDPDFQKRLREQVALEQKALDEQRKERELRDLLARQQADAERAASAARAKALNEYVARIQAKVKGNWILPQDIKGNPEAVFLVVQLPTGEVLRTELMKSSGNKAYDDAVERAILKSSPLPLPPAGVPLPRELKLTFRPQDK